MNESRARWRHALVGLAYFAAVCVLEPACWWLAHRSKTELSKAQAGFHSGRGQILHAAVRWARTPKPVPPRPIIPDPPATVDG